MQYLLRYIQGVDCYCKQDHLLFDCRSEFEAWLAMWVSDKEIKFYDLVTRLTRAAEKVNLGRRTQKGV